MALRRRDGTMRRKARGNWRTRRRRAAPSAARFRRRLGLEPLEPRHLLSANLLISEFMAANSSALADGDGRFSDWIEVHNAGPTAVNLSDYRLTDSSTD